MQEHLAAPFHRVDVVALGGADGAAKDRESQCFSSPVVRVYNYTAVTGGNWEQIPRLSGS